MRTIGRRIYVDLPGIGVDNILAKVDTGAYRSSLHYVSAEEQGGSLMVVFDETKQPVEFGDYQRKNITTASGERDLRYIITTTIRIDGTDYEQSFTLNDRSTMKAPVLIGRKLLLNGNFLVDVSRGVSKNKRGV